MAVRIQWIRCAYEHRIDATTKISFGVFLEKTDLGLISVGPAQS